MKYDQHLVSLPWHDYELLDSGDSMKLERFGEIIVVRPETQALWLKRRPELWETAHAKFAFRNMKGSWKIQRPLPESGELAWNDARFLVRLTGFKHTGVFPEQTKNWAWIKTQVEILEKPKILNLFGYTGIASIVAAQAGAIVTHVDASKQSLDWAHENARRSKIPEEGIRWILDDVLAFTKREARRGVIYDGIILDPPAFGRGAKGEVWKIDRDFPALLELLKNISSNTLHSFFLVSGYAAGYASRSFAQAIESTFTIDKGECGELHIRESYSDRVIPAGIYVRFVR